MLRDKIHFTINYNVSLQWSKTLLFNNYDKFHDFTFNFYQSFHKTINHSLFDVHLLRL